jgi:alkanesulfonate monooxygenase SsuD/methylene tetrahydromethanopterin reductase-like flavin-dependent oxidoreductase (luciferase family)
MLGEQPASVSPRDHFESILRQVEAGQRNGFCCYVVGHHFVVSGGARWLHPVPLLARLAAEVDPDVQLVTWILVSPLYPPVLLAEELATLDIVTEGRLAVGLGVGYRPEEYAALGVPYAERNRRFEEGIAILKAMWTSDRVDYEGRFTTLRDAHVHVRPVQTPHPPIWIGAQSPGGIRRAAALGDAWAISPPGSLEVLRDRFNVYTTALADTGKSLRAQPFRQEIVIAGDRSQAAAEAGARTAAHYGSIGRVGSGPRSGPRPGGGFVLGSAADCAAQLTAIADEFPVDPMIPRALWPSMNTDQAIVYIDTLGRELLPVLRDHRPAMTYPGSS